MQRAEHELPNVKNESSFGLNYARLSFGSNIRRRRACWCTNMAATERGATTQVCCTLYGLLHTTHVLRDNKRAYNVLYLKRGEFYCESISCCVVQAKTKYFPQKSALN